MLKTRLEAAHAVRDAYLPLKRGVAEMANAAGTCLSIMTSERQKPGFNTAGFGATPIALVAEAAAHIAKAEQCLADAHPELGRMIETAGLRGHYVYGSGPDETVDPREVMTRIRAVA